MAGVIALLEAEIRALMGIGAVVDGRIVVFSTEKIDRSTGSERVAAGKSGVRVMLLSRLVILELRFGLRGSPFGSVKGE